MFTATGNAPSGRKQTITWSNGKFDGEKTAIAEFCAFSKENELVSVANMTMKNDHKDPLAAMALASTYFMSRAEFTGDVPTLPPVPDGAIA